MNRILRKGIVITSIAMSLGALSAVPAAAQSDPHQHEAQGAQGAPGAKSGGMGGQGMGGQGMGGMMSMMDMMQNCQRMAQSRGHGLPHLPPGNEKLELQMHADMMKAMADILSKYAARLPDRK